MEYYLDEPWAWRHLDASPIVGFLRHVVAVKEFCESPIEVQLGAAILQRIGLNSILAPQYKWQKFRIDFAILDAKTRNPLVFVECDGAEFHSTPEQIFNDRRKDEAASTAKIPLLRFTGKEIYWNRDFCADRVAMQTARQRLL